MNQKRSREWVPRQEAAAKPIKPSPRVLANPELYFRRLIKSVRDVLLYFYNNQKLPKGMHMTQDYIAKKLGCSRGTISRALGILQKDGLIYSHYRHLTSSVYYMSSWLQIKMVRRFLALFMPRIFSFLLLLSPCYKVSGASIQPNVTQLKKVESKKKINRDTQSKEIVTKGLSTPPAVPKVVKPRNTYGERMPGFEKKGEQWIQIKPSTQPKQEPIPKGEGARFDLSGSNPLLVAIRNIQNIKLSEWGQIKIAAFHPSAIMYADQQIRVVGEGKDPFERFMLFCVQYSAINNLEVKIGVSDALAKKYEMPKENVQFYINDGLEDRHSDSFNFEPKKTLQRRQILERRGPQPKRTADEVAKEVDIFHGWQESERAKKFIRAFGPELAEKPFWIHEIK